MQDSLQWVLITWTLLKPGPRASRFAAVYGILGTLLIPLNYYVIELFGSRGMHPENLDRGSLGAGMRLPFAASVATGLVALWHFVALREDIESRRAEAPEITA